MNLFIHVPKTKRYEKMTKEEIIKLYSGLHCSDCHRNGLSSEECNRLKDEHPFTALCREIETKWLEEEV